MKTTRKTPHRPTKKALIIAGSAIVLVLGLLAIYVFALGGNLFGWQPTKQITPTSSQTTKTTTPTQNETPATTGESTNNSAKNSTPPATTPSNDTLTVTFTHISTTSLGVLIQGLVSGTCTLTLTKPGSTTVTMTADTFQSASSSTCQGFNYDATDGGWTATVTVKTNGGATGSATQAIE